MLERVYGRQTPEQLAALMARAMGSAPTAAVAICPGARADGNRPVPVDRMDSAPPPPPATPRRRETVSPQTLQSAGPGCPSELECLGPESNQGHGDFQSPALPTELPRRPVPDGARRRRAGRLFYDPGAEGKSERPETRPDFRTAAPRRGRPGSRAARRSAPARSSTPRGPSAGAAVFGGWDARDAIASACSSGVVHAIAVDALVPVPHLEPEPDPRLVDEEAVLELVQRPLERRAAPRPRRAAPVLRERFGSAPAQRFARRPRARAGSAVESQPACLPANDPA